MPLSEEENRLLEQMERALAAEDPKLASTMRGRTVERAAKLRTAGAGLVFLIGLCGLMGGAILGHSWLGVLGFVVMFASATLGLNAWRGRHAAPPAHPAPAEPDHGLTVIDGGRRSRKEHPKQRRSRRQKPRRDKSGTFMQRMERRWEHRRQQGF